MKNHKKNGYTLTSHPVLLDTAGNQMFVLSLQVLVLLLECESCPFGFLQRCCAEFQVRSQFRGELHAQESQVDKFVALAGLAAIPFLFHGRSSPTGSLGNEAIFAKFENLQSTGEKEV